MHQQQQQAKTAKIPAQLVGYFQFHPPIYTTIYACILDLSQQTGFHLNCNQTYQHCSQYLLLNDSVSRWLVLMSHLFPYLKAIFIIIHDIKQRGVRVCVPLNL